MLIVPVSVLPNQTFNLVLDEQYCTVTIYWKQIRLYMDLRVDDLPVFTGAICQNAHRINLAPTLRFRGTFHFFDVDGQRAPDIPGLDTRYNLIYLSEGEDVPDMLRY